MENYRIDDPPMFIALNPKSRDDRDKIGIALAVLAVEDPFFRVETDIESGQIIVMGRDELQFELLVQRLLRQFDIKMSVGAPQAAYRETVTWEHEVSYTHEKKTSGKRQFARVTLVVMPAQPGEGYSFESTIAHGSMPEEYISGVKKGIQSVMELGPLGGFPMIDVKVTLTDGTHHDADSSALAFEIAARAGMRAGVKSAGAKLLEPIMKVEVVSPEEYTGGIIGDLISRRGIVTGQDSRGNDKLIKAIVPLGNMLGYFNTLQSMTLGRGNFTMQYSHHAAVDPAVHDPDDNFPMAMAMRA
jgi:elongation factor G